MAARAPEALPELTAKAGRRSFKVQPAGVAVAEIDGHTKIGVKLVAPCEPDYPEALAAVEDASPIFSVLGQISLLHKRAVGIVGSRNAPLNGRKMAKNLARDLGKQGIVIACGLARLIGTVVSTAAVPGSPLDPRCTGTNDLIR